MHANPLQRAPRSPARCQRWGWRLAAALSLAAAALAPSAAWAKSLYLIANINASPSPIRTYDIQPAPAHLVFQAQQTIPARAGGAVGLAVDTANRKLFTTYEGSNVIQLVDAVNFSDLGTTTAPGASNLAGIVVDQGKGKVYAVDRNTNHLYVYTWNSATNTLTLDGGSFVTLAGVASAHGLALDESRGRLYVGDNDTTTIRYYNTTGWGIAGSIAVTGTAQTPMGIAIDTRRNLLYYGNAYGPYGSRGQLVKIDVTAGSVSQIYTLPGATTGGSGGDNIVGVAVDEDTGNVYATTGNQGTGGTDTLIAFDSGLNVLKNDIGDLGNPTGLAIPTAGVSYNPLNFSKTASGASVASGGNLGYQLCYDNLANATAGVTGVTITDAVPAGTTFVSATGPASQAGGVVTWTLGDVAAGAAQVCHQLVVNVTAAAGSTVFNSATISGTIGGAVVPTTQTATTNVLGGYLPLVANMTDSADPVPTASNVTYTTCVNPGTNSQTVNSVRIDNPIPTGTSFVSASAGGTFDGSSVRWDVGDLEPETGNVCVDLTLMVTATPGSQITNRATVSSDNTSPLPVSHATDVTSNYQPLPLSYDDGVATVASGSQLTLQICYSNTTNTLPVSGVQIRGLMPDGTSYVSHTGPGSFDGTRITWAIGTLAAGAPQVCHELVVRVDAAPGENISGGMVLSSNEVQPSSSANHTTAVVEGLQPVVIIGQGEGGGGAVGALEALLGAVAALAAAVRRRRRVATTLLGALALVAVAAPAAAQGGGRYAGWYAGLGGGAVDARASAARLVSDLAGLGHTVQATLDDTDSGWKLVAGYQALPFLAVEGFYVDLGRVESRITGSVPSVAALVADVPKVHPWSITGVGLAGVLSAPVGNNLSVHAKLGFVRWEAEARAFVSPAGTPSASLDDKGTGALFGLGAGWEVPNTRWTVRLEWERYQTRRNDPDFLSLSVLYRF